jgi:signal peptidase I
MKPFAKPLANYLWREWIRPLALPCLAVLAAKSALADINPVPTGSMKPTVLEGDVVFVNKLAYDLKIPFTTKHLAEWANPVRGDIVVCFSPQTGTRLLKRVIAQPGDTVELRSETLLLNGHPVAYEPLRPQISGQAGIAKLPDAERKAALFATEQLGQHAHAIMVLPRRPARRTFGPITVPAGSYFVMGDNRDNSEDSRYFGFVPRDQIVGQAKGVFVSADLDHWLKPRFERFFTALD